MRARKLQKTCHDTGFMQRAFGIGILRRCEGTSGMYCFGGIPGLAFVGIICVAFWLPYFTTLYSFHLVEMNPGPFSRPGTKMRSRQFCTQRRCPCCVYKSTHLVSKSLRRLRQSASGPDWASPRRFPAMLAPTTGRAADRRPARRPTSPGRSRHGSRRHWSPPWRWA